ncbi:MAG: beta-propeller domain-containing protein [Thermoplasmatales archaeon]|nr:MAG: beta-propeller domain-containing protein [Thermoplasmatales archaeon]
MDKKSLKKKEIAFASIIIIISFVYAINVQPSVFGNSFDWFFRHYFDNGSTSDLKTFSSYDDFIDYLQNNWSGNGGYGWYYLEDWGGPQVNLFSTRSTGKSMSPSSTILDISIDGETVVDYSKTNNQVEGMDEPDIIKTDGTYIYMIANSKVYIINAYPTIDSDLFSEISLNNSIYVNNIFINENKLVIFGSSYREIPYPESNEEDYIECWWPLFTSTIVNIYDVSNRKNPKVIKEIEIDGDYVDSRMINNQIYIITQEYTGLIYRIFEGNETINIPQVTINGVTKKLPANHIHYVDSSDPINIMTNVIAINLDNKEVDQESFLISSSENMYVSKNNIYLAQTSYEFEESLISSGIGYRRSTEKTIIHKISIKNRDISYITQGEVPGRILNQFSMDEHDGYFRIATTIGNVWDSEKKSSNNVYILDHELNRVSEIESIASGEQIYSARFMGEKAYLVTFKKVDPFFTLDLSDPKNPQVLGKLKIPGYSDYLHPFDENHIIGIGKDTVEAMDDLKESRNVDFAWYQGIKIALFDVSDFDNPKELSKVIIGDRGTSSPALYDHKAFLFDREKELLVIPISLCEIADEIKEKNNGYTGNIRGDFTFQGAYVYRLNLDGFEYRGRISHLENQDIIKTGNWGYYGPKEIRRSLYIHNILYTISDSMIKMNSLEDLSELNSLKLV